MTTLAFIAEALPPDVPAIAYARSVPTRAAFFSPLADVQCRVASAAPSSLFNGASMLGGRLDDNAQ